MLKLSMAASKILRFSVESAHVGSANSGASRFKEDYDSVIVVHDSINLDLPSEFNDLQSALSRRVKLDESISKKGAHFIADDAWPMVPAGRLIFSNTGPLNRDFDDSRRIHEAAFAGVQRALAAGSKHPVVLCQDHVGFPKGHLVTALGALHSLYVPYEAKDAVPAKVESIAIFYSNEKNTDELVKLASALEAGRTVARDVCGGHPHFMTPGKTAEYITEVFAHIGGGIKLEIVSDQSVIEKEYPLMQAVNRAVKDHPHYQSRLIKLDYQGAGETKETLMFVGKGVTFDTGGMDLKIGGAMLGMHRDKGGASAVFGIFAVIGLLQPKNVKACAYCPMVRNGIGIDAYTCDEVITSRSGKRVRIINTDAEGRMIMSDPLTQMKDRALSEVNPHVFTIATLTGHAVLTVGEGYSIAMDNGPARKKKFAESMQKSGDLVADPWEITTCRREDIELHSTNTDYEDCIQATPKPSSQTMRGHQIPMAFMQIVSGLIDHGTDSDRPIAYTHCDIAGSEGKYPGYPAGAPVLAFVERFFLD